MLPRRHVSLTRVAVACRLLACYPVFLHGAAALGGGSFEGPLISLIGTW